MTSPFLRRLRSSLFGALASIAALVALASCAGDGSTLDPLGRPLPPARAALAAATIERVLVEGATAEISIELRNEGGLPLRVLDATVDASFLEPDFDGPFTIAGGDSTTVVVRLRAGSAADSPQQGTVTFTTDDPESPTLSVLVTLEISASPIPDIALSPAALDLTFEAGSSGTASVTVENAGSGALTLFGAQAGASWATARPVPASPIAPGASVELVLDVSAAALTLGAYATTLTITSDDPDEPSVAVPIDLWVGPFAPTLSAIQANVFTPSCVLCHESSGGPVGLELAAGQSWGELVNVSSTEVGSLLRVEPGVPDDSYLVIKLEGTDPRMVGQPMPLGPPLEDGAVEVVREWIARGALDD